MIQRHTENDLTYHPRKVPSRQPF
uniref:Uncharacterized protein n=1 Tax=Anguilla anguilla TaxID=7936 RepID=A0A0E9QRU5_ANGAN